MTISTVVRSPGPTPSAEGAGSIPFSSLPGVVLGLRWLALAAVAAAAALAPFSSRVPVIMGGIAASALIAAAQFVATRAGRRAPGAWLVLLQVVLWTCLAQASGGTRSPLLVAYVLEIPLSGFLLGRGGVWLAAGAGTIACLGMLGLAGGAGAAPAVAVVGFIAVAALLALRLIELGLRQQRAVDVAHELVCARADHLAVELRLLGEYVHDALLGIDAMGRVVSVNPAALTLLGVSHERAIDHPWQEILHLDPDGRDALIEALADPQPRDGVDLRLVNRRGGSTTMSAEIWTGGSGEGRRTWILLSAPATAGEPRDPLRRLGEAAACVSHQIRNSLHALEGFAREIEQDGPPPAGTSRPTRHLLQALRNLGTLSDDVLSIAGSPRGNADTVALHEVVASAALLARHPLVRVEIEARADEVWVHARRGGLVHALFNLIDNACRASRPDQAVRVTLVARGPRAIVEIVDQGPGFGAAGDGREHRRSGRPRIGYGLLAARRFLEHDDAEIEFDRMPGAGTRCRVSLRRATAPPVAERSDG